MKKNNLLLQGRGAGHIHGVFWIDLKAVKIHSNYREHLLVAFEKLRNRQTLSKDEGQALAVFTDMFVTCSRDPKRIEKRFKTGLGKEAVKIANEVNWHSHSQSCRKKSGEGQCRFNFPKYPLPYTEFVDGNKVYEEGEKLSEERRNEIIKKVKKVLIVQEKGKSVVSPTVKKILEEKTERETIADRIEKILKIADTQEIDEDFEEKEVTKKKQPKKKKKKKITLDEYIRAVVQQPIKGSTVLLQRDIDEIFMNNYNPEMITTWDANMDLQPTFDYYAVITYINDYVTKMDKAQQDFLLLAIKQIPKDQDFWKRCIDLANMFQSHRQVGEAEVYYKLFPHMNLTYSSVATVFVPTGSRKNRSNFLMKQDPKTGKGFSVKDRNGLFLEKQDLISKYERICAIQNEEEEEEDDTETQDILDNLTYCQFVKMYQARSWSQLTTEDRNEKVTSGQGNYASTYEIDEGALNKEDNLNFLVTGHNENTLISRKRRLPEKITLKDKQPGESAILHLRTFPRAISYFKQSEARNPHEFYLQELQLFVPFKDETDLHPEDEERCKEMYENKKNEIEIVKAQLMPFLKSAEDARMIHEQNNENAENQLIEDEDGVGLTLDPEKEQEIADAEEEGEEDHHDYLHIDPDLIEEQKDNETNKKVVCRKIEITSIEDQVKDARTLDKMQKKVLSLGLQYAKAITKARNQTNRIPQPPLVMVHGGAGSGKSKVIHTLAPMMTHILQEAGDEPDCPYVVLTAFLGSAAANISGATLHHTFGFKFGTKFVSLSDKRREEKRCQFRNLKCVIIDEISLVSSDLLYCLDQQLKDIMKAPTKVMGGVSVFVFGDLFQLQPVRGRYVFQKPSDPQNAISCELRNIWQMFTVVILEENHRQGDDKSYADLLNRLRVGNITDEDLKVLETRVRSEDHEDIKNHSDDLHIYGTNKKVNARNEKEIEKTTGRMYTIKAANNSRMIRNFKPTVDSAKNVKNTPLQAVLKVKIGIQVILVWNVDVADGLVNGSRGILLDIEMAKDEKSVKKMIVKFHNKKHGADKRARDPCHKYPEATYIYPYTHQYHLGGSTATCQQFPLKMAAGLTSHKIQGQTVAKPNCLVIDIRDTFEAGMVYVMLSRVCNINQLFILEEINKNKIKTNPLVLKENERMKSVSVNLNPTPWNDKRINGIRISALNVRSLRKHIEDVKSDHFLLISDVICLSETWLEEEQCNDSKYQIEGFRSFFNCQKRNNETFIERGKGLATYVRGDMWKWEADVTELLLHMTKLTSEKLDIISVYRSQDQPFTATVNHLKQLVNLQKTTLIIGDFNYCAKNNSNDLSEYLSSNGFQQLVTTATHTGGNVLDQIHFRGVIKDKPKIVETIAEYYSDHDLVTLLIPSGKLIFIIHSTIHQIIKGNFNIKPHSSFLN